MPMDIRSFFGKATNTKSKKSKPTPSNDEAKHDASDTRKKAEKPKASSIEAEKPGKKISPHFSKKEKVTIEIDDDDSDTDDGFTQTKPAANKSTVAAKKRKVPEEEEVEITPEEFFANPSKKKSKPEDTATQNKKTKQRDPSPEPSPSPSRRNRSTRQAAVASRKRIREANSDFMDSDEEAEGEDVVAEEEKPKPKRTSKPKTESKPPSSRNSKSEAESKPSSSGTSSPSPAKRSRKPAAPEKKKLIEPELELDRFDVNSVQVPELLEGLTFVFTGVLDDFHRDDAIDLIKTLGGRVTTAVSGKTNYLVVGKELEDGRPYHEGKKYQSAVEKSVLIVLGKKQLFGLCHEYHEQAKRDRGIESPPKFEGKTQPTKQTASEAKQVPSSSSVKSNPYAKKPVTNPYAKPASNPYAKKAPASNPYAKTSSQPEKAVSNQNVTNQLWVDRHAPQSTRDILGNKEHVTKLASWLSSWERTFNNSKSYGKAFSNPKGPWKAALLSGPPGIGKTTTATLVAKEAGRDLLEFNASDARSKKALQNSLGDITGSHTLGFSQSASGKKKNSNPLRCIIMDEVDGMGAGDRSGMAELIQMIKKSKVPIICICNDRQSQKMKSLVPYCMDLRFRRPTKSVMATRALRIAEEEGFEVERNAAEAIAESCGNDVRQVLNCLQMWAQKGENSLTYRGLKERENSIKKDEILRVSLFDAAKTILEGRRNLSQADAKAERDSLFRRSDAFFVDYSFTGLLVQQNYPRVMQGQFAAIKRSDDPIQEQEFLERMHLAAASMSDYAVAEHEIRNGDLNWGLLPACGMLAVQTGYHAGGETGGFLPGFPEFTAWMGKNSTKGKKMRLLSEIHHHMNYKVSGNSQDVRESYLPVLREKLLKYIHSGEEGAAKDAIALMDDYGLSREDVMEKLDEFKMGSEKDLTFADLDSKQKAAFTREYNQGSHKSQALVAEQGASGTSRKSGGRRERDPADLDAIDEDPEEEESEEEDEEAEMKKLQEKFKKKGRKTKAPAAKGKKK